MRAFPIARLFVAIAFATMPLPAPAQSFGAANLPGWWISIDDTGHKPLQDRGVILAMEELLIIDERLNYENRMMRFFGANQDDCRTGGPCSDAPLMATGRLALTAEPPRGFRLSIESADATRNVIDRPEVDPPIRARAISSTRNLLLAVRQDGADTILSLRVAADGPARLFFKIEPDRLRRLRAGFLAAEASALQHWRCWLAAATGATGQTPPFRAAAELPPRVADYLRVASYWLTAQAQFVRSMPDHPDPAQRNLAFVQIEELMNEHFDALPRPSTWEETRRPAFIAKYIEFVMDGQTPAAATAALKSHDPQFEPPDIPAAQLAAAPLARADTAEAKRMFCKP